MELNRKLNYIEEKILIKLIEKAHLEVSDLQNILVLELNDGGMGSLRLQYEKVAYIPKFGRMASEIQIKDADDTPVLISLYLDQYDNLFEIDIWKIDFSAVIEPNLEIDYLA